MDFLLHSSIAFLLYFYMLLQLLLDGFLAPFIGRFLALFLHAELLLLGGFLAPFIGRFLALFLHAAAAITRWIPRSIHRSLPCSIPTC